jgi:hypothetical protein
LNKYLGVRLLLNVYLTALVLRDFKFGSNQ